MIGDMIVMPEPTNNDAWINGNFNATIIKELNNGDLIVEDQEGNGKLNRNE